MFGTDLPWISRLFCGKRRGKCIPYSTELFCGKRRGKCIPYSTEPLLFGLQTGVGDFTQKSCKKPILVFILNGEYSPLCILSQRTAYSAPICRSHVQQSAFTSVFPYIGVWHRFADYFLSYRTKRGRRYSGTMRRPRPVFGLQNGVILKQ